MKDIVWKKKTGKYQSGEYAMMGSIVLGSFEWNMIDRGPEKKYVSTFALPGFKLNRGSLGYFPTEEKAKQAIESAIRQWFAEVS